MTNNTKYVVNFVVENAVGNQSTVAYTPVVPKDSSAKQEEKVTDVVVDDSSDNQIKVKFTEPTEHSTVGGYTITIYNENEEVVAEVDASSSDATSGKDITDNIPEGGKYTVTVITKGGKDGASKASDETEPVEFEVSQLAEVTGIHFETDEETDEVYLKWDEYSDAENEAFNGYTIKIYKYNPVTKDYAGNPTKTKNIVDKALTEIKITEVDSFAAEENTRYKAVISANSSKGKVKASKETETEKDYFNLVITNVTPTDITDTSMKLPLTTATDIKLKALGDEVTYDVEVWSKTSSSTAEEHFAREGVRENVTVDESGKILIDGLKPNTEYKFVLVVHIDGNEAEGRSKISEATEKSTLKTLPSIEGRVVVKPVSDETKTNNNGIGASVLDLLVNGEKIEKVNFNKYYDPNSILKDNFAVNLVNSLNNGDTIVSVTKEKVTIKPAQVATNGKDREINARGRVVEIIGNNYEQDIKAVTDNAKEVILNGGLFKVNKESTSKFTLENGVKVKTDISLQNEKINNVSINAGSTATIDDVEISSSATLNVTVYNDGNNNRALTINEVGNDTITINNKSGKKLIVEFAGDATIGENQLGKVTVESNADVIIRTKDKATVGADVSVSTTNGSIDISGRTLTGAKEVTVTTDKTATGKQIKARTKLTSPIALNNKEILPYTFEQLKELKDKGTAIKDSTGETTGALSQSDVKSLSEEELKQLVDYFNAFGSGLMNIGAKISGVSANQESVTITLPKGSEVTLDSVTVEGLK